MLVASIHANSCMWVSTCKQLHVSHVIPDQYSQWHWKPSRNELVVDELLVLTYRLYVNNVNTTYRRTCAYSLSQRWMMAVKGVLFRGGNSAPAACLQQIAGCICAILVRRLGLELRRAFRFADIKVWRAISSCARANGQ